MVRKLDLGMEVFRKVRDFFLFASCLLGSQNVGSLEKVSLRHSSCTKKHPKVLPVLDLQSGVEAKTYPTAKELPEMFTWNHPTLSLVGFGWLISGANIYIYTHIFGGERSQSPTTTTTTRQLLFILWIC